MIDYKGWRILKLSRSAYAAGILDKTVNQLEYLRIFEKLGEALEYIGYEREKDGIRF